MKALLLLTALFFFGQTFAQDTTTLTYFFNGNFNENSGDSALREISSTNCAGAGTGVFGTDSIITSNGLCTNGDSANTFQFKPGDGVQYGKECVKPATHPQG